MPWTVSKDENACSASKPWAVKNKETGRVSGCHETKEQAEKQREALYASYKKGGKNKKMEEYPQIVRAITGTPWLIVPENLKAILNIVNMRLNGDAFSDEEIEMRLRAAKEEDEHENPRVQADGGVGVVSLYGPIFPKANLMTMLSGATSLDTFTDDLRMLMADDKVKQIVIDFNTPGGTSDMVEETGNLIKQMSETKPIYGIANTGANSAGYWLLSQCTKAYATPSGQVGSIGVYTTHEDTSAQDAKAGRKITVVSAGESKTLLNPHEPLSEEGEAYLKENVEELYDDFVSVVAEGRGVSKEHVLKNFGGGKVFSARKAKSLGMIDEVVSMNDLLGNLVEDNYSSRAVSVKGDLAHHVNRMQELLTSNDDKTAFGAANYLLKTALPVEVVDESKEWEHSEPGTGNPPQPRTEDDGSDDVAIRERWRRTTPPIAKPEEVERDTNSAIRRTASMKGGTTVAELTEKDLRELLRVVDVDDEGKLVESVKLMRGELDELKRNAETADQERKFAEAYPQYWEEHNKLMAKTREQDAKTFVESISKVRKAEGLGLKETRMGLSSIAREKIEEMHVRFSGESNELAAEFENCIKAVMNGGLVEFGEIGTSKNGEEEIPEMDTSSANGIAGSKKLFAELLAKVQKEDPKLSFQEAYAKVAEKHPDLAEASRVAVTA